MTEDEETAPSSSTSRTGNSGHRRADIVQFAAELFDSQGYHKASMDDLADAVGVAKPTLYHYFSGKAEILAEIHEDFIGLLLQRQAVREGSELPPSHQLLEVMGDILDLMVTHRSHVRVFFEHHRELPADTKRSVVAQRAEYADSVAGIIRAGIEAGEFREIDPELAALAVFGMCNWTYQWYRADGVYRAREIAYFMWGLVVNGIGTRTNHEDRD